MDPSFLHTIITEILEELMHSDVDAISFYRYESHLTFENGNKLSFSAQFRFAEERLLPEAAVFDFPLVESKLVRILGHQVHQVSCDSKGTIQLNFSNGDALIVFGDGPYEAYCISTHGKEYVFGDGTFSVIDR